MAKLTNSFKDDATGQMVAFDLIFITATQLFLKMFHLSTV